MCIYCGTDNYRKIYEHHYGSIPKEEDGRTYEIHHIDGNHSNNDPSNLKAVTLQEHYDIHYSQKDYYACYLISIQRMNKTPEELSELARLNVYKQIANGVNVFVGGEIQSRTNQRRLSDGTHHLLRREDGTSITGDRVTLGAHHFMRRSDGSSLTMDRTIRGENPWSRRPDGTSFILDRVRNGTHHLLGKNQTAENNPTFDHTIYSFQHKITGEIVSMTQYYFAKKYDLNKSNLNAMIKGNKKSCGGWKLLVS